MTSYVLEHRSSIGPYSHFEAAGPVHVSDRAHHMCPACGQGISALAWLPPYRVRLRRGERSREPGDVAFGPSDFIVSRRFVDVWSKHGLSGIDEFRPVSVAQRPDFYLPSFPTPRARLDYSKMRIAETSPAQCSTCGYGRKWSCLYGLHLDPTSCGSLDLFGLVNLSGTTLASARFKSIAETEGLLNIELVPLVDVWFDNLGGQDENAIRARLGMPPV